MTLSGRGVNLTVRTYVWHMYCQGSNDVTGMREPIKQ